MHGRLFRMPIKSLQTCLQTAAASVLVAGILTPGLFAQTPTSTGATDKAVAHHDRGVPRAR